MQPDSVGLAHDGFAYSFILCGYTEGALDMVFCNVCVQGQGIHKRKAWQGLPLASDLQPLAEQHAADGGEQ
jgi:hypothetical protein